MVKLMLRDDKAPSKRINLLIMAPFLCFYYWQLAHHVLWRDEFNVWGIVCVSKTWSEMFARVHYEAHPALWYAICYAASRITHSVWILKLVQGAIGTGIYLMLALTAPFKRLELALIFAGYYISFQYTVMCRMYGLEVLFALVYVWCRMRHPERMVRNTLWLGLIANVDVTAGILSAALLLEYLWERYEFYRASGALRVKPFAEALAAYAALCAISLATLWPAKDIGWSATGKAFSQFTSGEHIGSAFAKWAGMAFFPQSMDPVSLWFDPHLWPHGVIVPVVLGLFIWVFRGKKRLGWMLIAVTGMGILFSNALNVAGIRHIGIGFIAFLMALWMMRYNGEQVSKLSYVLLGLLVIGTFYNIKDQWGIPFADDDATAQWILQNHLEDMTIMGTPDTNVIGVPERLERPIYQIECNSFDRVMTFHHCRDNFNRDVDIPGRTVLGMKKLGGPVLFLINRPLTADELKTLTRNSVGAELLSKFDKGYVVDEHFFVYRLSMN